MIDNEKDLTTVELSLTIRDRLEELGKLQHLKKRSFDISTELVNISKRLNELSEELSPVNFNIKVGNVLKRKELVKDAKETLKNAIIEKNLEVDIDMIKNTYHELSNSDVNNIMTYLKSQKEIQSNRNGRRIVLRRK